MDQYSHQRSAVAVFCSVIILFFGWQARFGQAQAQTGYRLLPFALETSLPGVGARSTDFQQDLLPTPLGDALRLAAGQPPMLDIEPFILGGLPAPAQAYPWLVSIALANKQPLDGHFCGGSLIAREWVVTAAHCFSSSTKADSIVILTGTNTLDAGGRRYAVKEILINPEWNREAFTNDLALLRVEAVAAEIQIIPPLRKAEDPSSGDMGFVAGWGRTREGGKYSNRLRHVQLQTVSNPECNKPYAWNGFVRPEMFCAGFVEGGKDSCRGDSGGPFMLSDRRGSFVLGGIVSWGDGCGTSSKYGVYTRVSLFRKWIEKITGTQ